MHFSVALQQKIHAPAVHPDGNWSLGEVAGHLHGNRFMLPDLKRPGLTECAAEDVGEPHGCEDRHEATPRRAHHAVAARALAGVQQAQLLLGERDHVPGHKPQRGLGAAILRKAPRLAPILQEGEGQRADALLDDEVVHDDS
jgi:hypothetical protein